MNSWKNMKQLVQYIIWLYVSTVLQLSESQTQSQSETQTVAPPSSGSSSSCKGLLKPTESTKPSFELLPTRYVWNDSFVKISHNFVDVVFVKDPCNRARMAYAAISGALSGHIVATSDGFRKRTVILHIERSLLETSNPVLTSLTFVRDGLLTVINNKVVLFDVYKFYAKRMTGITASAGIDIVSTHMCCARLIKWCEMWSNTVVAYRSSTATNTLYYSVDGGKQFHARNISTANDEYKILGSTVLGIDITVVLLMEHVGTSQLVLLGMPLNRHKHFHLSWRGETTYFTSVSELTYVSGSSVVGLVQLFSNYYSLLIWDNTKIIYKPRLDIAGVDILFHRHGNDPLFMENEYIRHIDSNSLGEFLIITSRNRLLYGRESIRSEATYVPSLAPAISNSVVATFGIDGDVLLVSPNNMEQVVDNSLLYTNIYYLPDEIELLQEILPKCPYQNIKIEGFQLHYQLDIQDHIEFTTKLYTSGWQDVSLVAEVLAGRSLILSNTYKREPAAELGLIRTNMHTVGTYSLYQGHIASEHDSPEELMRSTALRVATTSTSLLCVDNSQSVAHITLGCNQEKRLVVNRAETNCERLRHHYMYEIAADDYDPDYGKFGLKTAVSPKTVEYNFRLFGCNNRTYYNNPFTFDLHVYKGTKYLGPMTGSYIVYEINGLNGFSYNLTVKDSPCLFTPQTWREMRLSAPDGTPLSEIWTRGNYRSCNISSGSLPRERIYSPNPNERYEILSYDNGNYITFNKNGLFMFEIIVVDHDYSFCDLRTHLAVDVYGVQPDVPIYFLLIMASTLGICIFLVIFGFCIIDYRRRKGLADEKERTEIEDFEDVIAAFLTEKEQKSTGLVVAATCAIAQSKRRKSTMTPWARRSIQLSLTRSKYSNSSSRQYSNG